MATTIRDPNRVPDVNRVELSGTVAAEPSIKRDAQERISRIALKLDVATPIGDDGRFSIDTFDLLFSRHCKPSLETLSLQIGRGARIRVKGPMTQVSKHFATRAHPGRKVRFSEACVIVFETQVIEAREPQSQRIPPIPSRPMGNRIQRVQQRSQARNEIRLGGDTFKVFDP